MRCQDFLPATKFKAIHHFLKHCDEGNFNLFEEIPIDAIRSGNITSYKILAQKHIEYCDCENSEELIDDFLKSVRCKLNPGENYVVIKGGFLIENLQPGPGENDSPIIDMRYWSTELYRTKYLNNYIFCSLKQNILKRVIVSSVGGNSLLIHRFV